MEDFFNQSTWEDIYDSNGWLIATVPINNYDSMNDNDNHEYFLKHLVHEYNEKAFLMGKPLLCMRVFPFKRMHENSLRYVDMLANINCDAVPELKEDLQSIKYWARRNQELHYSLDSGKCYLHDCEYISECWREYRENEGKNLEVCFKNIHELATYGEQMAQMLLAVMYEEGIGTEKNLLLALYWFDTSLMAPYESKKIHEVLNDPNISLKVDGINYDVPGYGYKPLEFWEEYYRIHNLN